MRGVSGYLTVHATRLDAIQARQASRLANRRALVTFIEDQFDTVASRVLEEKLLLTGQWDLSPFIFDGVVSQSQLHVVQFRHGKRDMIEDRYIRDWAIFAGWRFYQVHNWPITRVEPIARALEWRPVPDTQSNNLDIKIAQLVE
jgi:hypothetical protein